MLQLASANVPGHPLVNVEEKTKHSMDATSIDFPVGPDRVIVRAPAWLTRKGWSIHRKGYVYYTSRAVKPGIKRGQFMHRVIVEKIIGRPLLEREQIHHQDFNKTNNCWCNLLIIDPEFNPSSARRDPFTGEFMSASEWQRRYGYSSRMPDWVTSNEYCEEENADD